jgi:predicted methyltransferase
MTKMLVVLLLLLLFAGFVQASDFSAVETKVKAAMDADTRTEAEVERDRNRSPVATLEFFGLRDDMKVVELLPGGGWYTKLLAPVMAENGELYVALGTGRVKERVLTQEGFDKVRVVAEDAKIYRPEGSRFYALELDDLEVKDADIVFTFRNYHNFAADGREVMNRAAYDALKPGGIYAVVDHSRRHMEEDNGENRRRIDPVLAIREIEAAGFEFVDFSDLHFRPDDELRFEVGRKSVTGNTDRWTLKFRKPAD